MQVHALRIDLEPNTIRGVIFGTKDVDNSDRARKIIEFFRAIHALLDPPTQPNAKEREAFMAVQKAHLSAADCEEAKTPEGRIGLLKALLADVAVTSFPICAASGFTDDTGGLTMVEGTPRTEHPASIAEHSRNAEATDDIRLWIPQYNVQYTAETQCIASLETPTLPAITKPFFSARNAFIPNHDVTFDKTNGLHYEGGIFYDSALTYAWSHNQAYTINPIHSYGDMPLGAQASLPPSCSYAAPSLAAHGSHHLGNHPHGTATPLDPTMVFGISETLSPVSSIHGPLVQNSRDATLTQAPSPSYVLPEGSSGAASHATTLRPGDNASLFQPVETVSDMLTVEARDHYCSMPQTQYNIAQGYRVSPLLPMEATAPTAYSNGGSADVLSFGMELGTGDAVLDT
jgi:hypothetical protein